MISFEFYSEVFFTIKLYLMYSDYSTISWMKKSLRVKTITPATTAAINPAKNTNAAIAKGNVLENTPKTAKSINKLPNMLKE